MRTFAIAMLVSGIVGLPALAAPKKEPIDEAIEKGLEFLKNNQDASGCWKDSSNNKSPALTGLSLMAFLSAGHVPGEGKYGEVSAKAVRWLLDNQLPNGLIATQGHGEMYHHGICTLALAEALGMTDGKLADQVRQKLQKAIEIILVAQKTTGTNKGGWRYQVTSVDADLSITVWQLMALRAAKNLGCDIPPERIEWAVEYVKRCRDGNSGGFTYQAGSGSPSASRTGMGILALEICGKEWHKTREALKAGDYLLSRPPRWGEQHYYYAVYYSSQGMFQLGGNYWESFKPKLHKVLLDNQKDSGAWVGGDSSDSRIGPNYCTSMSVLALTVEYRFLPIYQRGEEREEKPK